jgi:hypothetical protein
MRRGMQQFHAIHRGRHIEMIMQRDENPLAQTGRRSPSRRPPRPAWWCLPRQFVVTGHPLTGRPVTAARPYAGVIRAAASSAARRRWRRTARPSARRAV